MRWFARSLLWIAALLFCIVASALWHLDTALGRDLARDILNDYVSGEMAGSMKITRIERLLLWDTLVYDTYVFDPNGAEVIHGEKVILTIDPIAALTGTLRFGSASLWNGHVTLIDNAEGQPTFLDAFNPADPTPRDPDKKPFHAIVDDMHLFNVDVRGELLDLRGIHLTDVEATGRMEFEYITSINVFSATGRLIEPFPFESKLESLVADIYSDERGSRLKASASRGDESADATLSYAPQKGLSLEDPYFLDLEIDAHPIRAITLQELGFEWAYIIKGEASGKFRMFGPDGTLNFDGAMHTDGGDIQVTGISPPEETKDPDVIQIASNDLELTKVIDGAPAIRLKGHVEFETPTEDESPTTLRFDVGRFVYEGIRVPPVTGSVILRPNRADIERLTFKDSDLPLKVKGYIDYVGNVDVHVNGRVPQLHREANLKKMVPGLSATAIADIQIKRFAKDEQIDVDGRLILENVVYDAVRAGSPRHRRRARGHAATLIADLRIGASEISVSEYPIGNGVLTLSGGPSDYRVDANFAASQDRSLNFAQIFMHQRVHTSLMPIDSPSRLAVYFGSGGWTNCVSNRPPFVS
ncbi:MAG: hypothetical protein R3A47_06540 [Polyangiales bacterium]